MNRRFRRGDVRGAGEPEMGLYHSTYGRPCFGGATYSWWSQPPTGWEILPKVTRQIIDEFSKALPE